MNIVGGNGFNHFVFTNYTLFLAVFGTWSSCFHCKLFVDKFTGTCIQWLNLGRMDLNDLSIAHPTCAICQQNKELNVRIAGSNRRCVWVGGLEWIEMSISQRQSNWDVARLQVYLIGLPTQSSRPFTRRHQPTIDKHCPMQTQRLRKPGRWPYLSTQGKCVCALRAACGHTITDKHRPFA